MTVKCRSLAVNLTEFIVRRKDASVRGSGVPQNLMHYTATRYLTHDKRRALGRGHTCVFCRASNNA